MPVIRLERMAVRAFCLGLLGFDHMQFVYDPLAWGRHLQDDWLVIEGVRDVTDRGPILGVQGGDGQLSLARANAASGLRLEARIGAPSQRSGKVISSGADAERLWPQLAEQATAIAALELPYIALALPGSPLPTINSASLISSLLHRAGYSPSDTLPSALRWAPGTETLIGTAADETLLASANFTTLLGGPGVDRLIGAETSLVPNKLYGGKGDDVCVWSAAVSVCHGGQPGLPRSSDGRDTVVFPQAASAILDTAPPDPADAASVGLSVQSSARVLLYSIETLQWSQHSDDVTLAPAIFASNTPLQIDLASEDPYGRGDVLDLSASPLNLAVAVTASALLVTSPSSHVSLKATSVETLIASPAADVIRIDAAMRAVDAGGGDDVIMVRPNFGAIAVDVGGGANTLVVDLSQVPPAAAPGTLDVTGGDSDDRLLLIVPPAGCGSAALQNAARIRTVRGLDSLTLAVTIPSHGNDVASLRFHDFADGHWGIVHSAGEPVLLTLPAGPIDDCASKGEAELGRRAGIAAASVPIISKQSNGQSREEHAWRPGHVCNGDPARRGTCDCGRRHAEAPRRPIVHVAGRRRTHRRAHRRRRDDRTRRRYRGAPRRSVGTRAAAVYLWRCRVAPGGRSAGRSFRTAPGPPRRTRLRRSPCRPLGPPLGARLPHRQGGQPRMGPGLYAEPWPRARGCIAGKRVLPHRTAGA